ncbi:hypothetical protein Hanom_Chr16g01483911 [Helianthus anomalus]
MNESSNHQHDPLICIRTCMAQTLIHASCCEKASTHNSRSEIKTAAVCRKRGSRRGCGFEARNRKGESKGL